MQEETFPAEALAEPVRQSYLRWSVAALGFDAILLPLVGVLAFLVVLLLVFRGRGPAMVGAILLVTPLPIYWAAFSAIKGIVASLSVIAMSEVAPKPSEFMEGIAQTLFVSMFSILVTIPAFLVAAIGLTVRALTEKPSVLERVESVKVLP